MSTIKHFWFKSLLILAAILTTSISADAQTFNGDAQDNTFSDVVGESNTYFGRGGYDHVIFEGSVANYGFFRTSHRVVQVWNRNRKRDILDKVEGVSFTQQGQIIDLKDIFAPLAGELNVRVFYGAETDDIYRGFSSHRAFFSGNGGVDRVNYPHKAEQYSFEEQADGMVLVTKPNGDVDRLNSIEILFFIGENAAYDIDDLLHDPVEDIDIEEEAPEDSDGAEDPNKLYHFGEAVNLVGANIAWSTNSRFSSDFGRSDGFRNPNTNLIDFQAKFDEIARNGGNSARIWLHTTAQISPHIEPNGQTVGLSRELSNRQVVDQMKLVLDSAWDRGILVTFSLFSFDMVCDRYQREFGYTGSMFRNHEMLTTQRQAYFDTALTPMVAGLKDHPALFAYEIFNEPEGMYETYMFCDTEFPIIHEDAVRFVNEAAALIHGLDSNVKVTTSTHTELYNDFTNETLTSLDGAKPEGILDFLELHWYEGWAKDPYTTPKTDYDLDIPIIIGEYAVYQARGTSDNPSEDSISDILANGFAGAWPWSLATVDNASDILAAINAAQQTPIDKQAIELCIRDKSPSCYKR